MSQQEEEEDLLSYGVPEEEEEEAAYYEEEEGAESRPAEGEVRARGELLWRMLVERRIRVRAWRPAARAAPRCAALRCAAPLRACCGRRRHAHRPQKRIAFPHA